MMEKSIEEQNSTELNIFPNEMMNLGLKFIMEIPLIIQMYEKNR